MFRFNARKSTQVAAALLKKAPQASIHHSLLLKLIYLVDREALSKWGVPITGDEPHLLESGPVPSHIYDLTRGSIRYAMEWDPFIVGERQQLRLVRDPGADELSESEQEILDSVFNQFGRNEVAALQAHCLSLPECQGAGEPGRSRPIRFERILEVVGKSPEEIQYIVESERASLVLRDLAGA